VRKSAETRQTSSPSMDISKASNFERFVFDLAGRRAELVAELWREVEGAGSFDLSGTPLMQALPGYGFVSGTSTHADRLATIRRVWEDHGVEIDPHTADGVKVGLEHREPGVPLVCLETALPIKFEATIQEALGRAPGCPERFRGLEALPQRVVVMPPDADQVKSFIEANS
jgi:threonine synthase